MTTKIKVKKLSNKFVYFLYMIVIIIFVVIAQIFLNKKIVDNILVSLNYLENGSVNYRVYYKENPFYTEPYIESNKSYVSQYVDYIDTTFDYYRNYSEVVNGNYKTNIKATLLVYEPGNEDNDYWKKTYKIMEEEKENFNSNDYHIKKNIKIDFNKYLKDYQEYKKSSVVSSNAKVLVEMSVVNAAKYKDLEAINNRTSLVIDIPLSDATFKISTKNNLNDEQVKYSKTESNKNAHIFATIIGYSSWGFVIILGISFITRYKHDLDKQSKFDKRLKKILISYDSILVECKKMPYVGDLSVVFVTSFEELVDAQNEVRLPINYKIDKNKQTATFILIRNSLAWVYQLKGSDLNDES